MDSLALYNECCSRFEYIDGTIVNKISVIGSKNKAGDRAGYLDKQSGYRKVRINGKMHYEHRIIFLLLNGYLPENCIDHIDRDKANNKIENLREVSVQCNSVNTGVASNSTTGVKGVCFDSVKNKYLAHIKINGVRKNLGHFDNKVDAVKKRLAAEISFGFARCDSKSSACLFIENSKLT